MADTAKRKKLEKSSTEPIRAGTQKFYCCRCSDTRGVYSRQKGYFPVSHSPMYRGTGYLPICNDCLDEMYDEYKKEFNDERAAMRRMCMKLDLYWNDSIYDMVDRTAGVAAGVNSRVRNYIGKTNLYRFIDKTFDNTLREEKLNQIKSEAFNYTSGQGDIIEPIQIEQEIIDFWGSGFASDFYIELERRYKDWTTNITINDPSERALYKQICILEATINRDSSQGKAIDKSVNSLNTLLGSMNLKPTQKKEDQDSIADGTPFGVWIKRWENTRPVPEPDPDFEDVDGIIKYISIWFLGHLCKMLGIRNAYCKLYEDKIAEMRIERPEYEDEDDETLFNDIFNSDSKKEDSNE